MSSLLSHLTIFWMGVGIVATVAQHAACCTFCFGFPDQTIVDRIMRSDCCALATLSPKDPFAFATTEVLKGDYPGGSIDLFVNSSTRRRLAANHALRVLLVRNGKDKSWHSQGVLSPAYEQVIRRVAWSAEHWSGTEGRQKRVTFFLPLFGHDDPQIRELTYLEMGRAPYAVIRQLGRVAPREAYSSLLEDPKYLKWRSLAILLLAQSEDESDKQFVRDSFRAVYSFRMTTNLAAWTAAAIEVDGPLAVDAIENEYLRRIGSSPEEIRAVFAALSILASQGDLQLRDRIAASYELLRAQYPEMDSQLANAMHSWNRSDVVRGAAGGRK